MTDRQDDPGASPDTGTALTIIQPTAVAMPTDTTIVPALIAEAAVRDLAQGWFDVLQALVRHAALGKNPLVHRHCPMLAHAAESIGHYAIRQRGTLGGSLAHADPAAQLPLAALALDAEIEIWSATARRTVPAREFFVSIFTTVINPGELIVAVHAPVRNPRDGWGFRLFNRRAGDFAIVSVAATLRRAADGAAQDLRLAIGGIGPIPVRVETLITDEIAGRMSKDWPATVAATVADAVEIEDNERTPVDFRRELVAALTRDALDQALENAR